MDDTMDAREPLNGRHSPPTKRRNTCLWVLGAMVLALLAAFIAESVLTHKAIERLNQRVREQDQTVVKLRETTQANFSAASAHTQSEIKALHDASAANFSEAHAESNKIEQQVVFERLQRQANVTTLTSEIAALGIHTCMLSCQNGGLPDEHCSVCVNCTAGWTGKFCDIPEGCAADPPPCQNGGVVNQTTCSCSCPPQWDGPLCAVAANFTTDQFVSFYTSALDKSGGNSSAVDSDTLAQLSQSDDGLVLRTWLGNPAKANGQVTTQPNEGLAAFTYRSIFDPARRSNPLGGGQPASEAEWTWSATGNWQPEARVSHYRSVPLFLESGNPQSGGSGGSTVSYLPHIVMSNKDSREALQKFESLGLGLEVTEQDVVLFEARLPVNPSTGRLVVPLKSDFAGLFEGTNCADRKDVCAAYFDLAGTHVVFHEVVGGKRFYIRPWQAGARQPLGKSGSLHISDCSGGDETLCSSSPEEWAASVATSPALIKYSTVPMSAVVSDPLHRALWQLAIVAYVDGTLSSTVNRCPKTCHNGGYCASPSDDVCTCTAAYAGPTCEQKRVWRGVAGDTVVVPAFSCPNFIQITARTSGRNANVDYVHEYSYVVVNVNGKPINGGSSSASLANVAAMGIGSERPHGRGSYGYIVEGIVGGTWTVNDVTVDNAINLAHLNTDYSTSQASFEVTCG